MYKKKHNNRNEVDSDIRTRLVSLRDDADISRRKLCDGLSQFLEDPISENLLGKYENGGLKFPLKVIIAYTKYFGCTLDYIIWGNEKKYTNAKLKTELENLEKSIKKCIDNLSE